MYLFKNQLLRKYLVLKINIIISLRKPINDAEMINGSNKKLKRIALKI